MNESLNILLLSIRNLERHETAKEAMKISSNTFCLLLDSNLLKIPN